MVMHEFNIDLSTMQVLRRSLLGKVLRRPPVYPANKKLTVVRPAFYALPEEGEEDSNFRYATAWVRVEQTGTVVQILWTEFFIDEEWCLDLQSGVSWRPVQTIERPEGVFIGVRDYFDLVPGQERVQMLYLDAVNKYIESGFQKV